jgi:hypothetical protein
LSNSTRFSQLQRAAQATRFQSNAKGNPINF